MRKNDKRIILISVGLILLVTGNIILLILLGIVIGLGTKKAKKEKYSKIDIKNNGEYFRDIINGYTPGELSYIDDFDVDESDIVATLLNLELKGVISFKENSKEIEVNETNLQLSSNEEYILETIKSKKWDEFSNYKFKIKIIQDAVKHKLLKETKTKIKGIGTAIALFPIIFLILAGMAIFSSKNEQMFESEISLIVLIILAAGMMFLPVIIVIYNVAYNYKSNTEPFKRTEKGEEINTNLEGLKNYLNEYSLIEKRSYEEIKIWEDYLIYSVIFKQNSKLTKEIIEKYLVELKSGE